MNFPQLALNGHKSVKGPKAPSRWGRAKFQHRWLDDEDENGDKLRQYILPDKEDKYKAICSVCYTSLNVDNGGRAALRQHARTKIHKMRMDQIKRGEMP